MTRLCVLSIVCGVLLSAGVAAQSRPLPSFALTAADGSTVSSETLPQERPWLLVIAQQPCRACDGTLAVLNTIIKTDDAARVVIVLSGASALEMAGLSSRYANLGTWYRDPVRAVLPALGVGGSPVVVGVRGGTVQWSRNVASTSPSELDSLITSWLR